MEETFRTIASYAALGLEALVVLTVVVGALEALFHVVSGLLNGGTVGYRRQIWLRFATWILLSLEYALGADLIRTAIAPSWDDIGKLGAIAAIRIVLGFFLGRDIEEFEETTPAEGERRA